LSCAACDAKESQLFVQGKLTAAKKAPSTKSPGLDIVNERRL